MRRDRGRRRSGCDGLRRACARLLVGAGCAFGALLLAAPPLVAHAEISGPGCSGHIAGVDVAGVNSGDQSTAIPVAKDATVAVDLSGDTGSPPVVHVSYGLAGGFSVSKDASGTSTSVNVHDYATVSGLYLVTATSGPAGTCSAAALVRVDGNPLSYPLGILVFSGIVVGGLGVAGGTAIAAAAGPRDALSGGVASGGYQMPPDREVTNKDYANIVTMGKGGEEIDGENVAACCGLMLPMALLMTTLALIGVVPAVPGMGAAPAPRVRPARWRPRLSVLGIAGALIGSVCAVVFMELNANVYPTRAWTIRAVIGGLLVGLVLPSLGSAFAVWRCNRKIAALRPTPAPAPAGAYPGVAAPAAATHVVGPSGARAWLSPDQEGPQLAPGQPVRVVESRNDGWAQVETASGALVWVDATSVQALP